jgi:hypothetical protein
VAARFVRCGTGRQMRWILEELGLAVATARRGRENLDTERDDKVGF